MDQESNQMEQHPVQCRNGCGFYSNAGTDGLCSVCYKDLIKKKQQPPTNMPSSLAPAPGAMASLSIDESSSSSSSAMMTTTSPKAGSSGAAGAAAGPSLDTASPTVFMPTQADKRIESEQLGAAAALATSSSEISDAPAASTSSAAQDDDQGQKEGKKKKNRCLNCKKKVGLTGFTCRCGGLFCSIHRYSDKHECNFDYKELGAEEIRKSNPVIVAKKVQKI